MTLVFKNAGSIFKGQWLVLKMEYEDSGIQESLTWSLATFSWPACCVTVSSLAGRPSTAPG